MKFIKFIEKLCLVLTIIGSVVIVVPLLIGIVMIAVDGYEDSPVDFLLTKLVS